MQVIVNGLLTSYLKTGEGKIILFLHGWGDNSETFTRLTKKLQTEYQVLSLDLPGFGGTQPPPAAWGLSEYASFVKSWLKKIKTGEIYCLAGHSFGGSVAIAGLGTKSLQAGKLVLLASSGVRAKRTLSKKSLSLGAKAVKIPLYLLPAHKQKKLKLFLYKKAGSDIMLIPHMRQTFVKVVGQDVQAMAKLISQRTLLIYGSRDIETPVSYGRLLNQAIPGSRLEVIEAGHFLHQEQTERVYELIKNFLESA